MIFNNTSIIHENDSIKMNKELSNASYTGNNQLVKELLEKGADIDKSQAFSYASKGKRWNIVKFLSRSKKLTYHPRNINVQRGQIETALRFMNDRNSNDDSYLIKACEEGDYNTVKVLLSLGVDVNKAGDEGHTPLMEAVMWNRTGIVKMLLRFGANKYTKDIEGKDSVQMAKENGNLEIIKLLS